MEKTLNVYLHDHLVGDLIQDSNGQMLFAYAQAWLEKPDAIPLSRSLPLRVEQFSRNECRPFFAGVLPEEGPREIVAHNLHISNHNDFKMLEEIGGECAGAVTFVPAGEAPPAQDSQYLALTSTELAETLRRLPKRPLLAGENGIRLSLAGAQNKLAVRVSNGDISIPLGAAPSTHILKPPIARLENSVPNEAFCMTLAGSIGLPTAAVQVRKVEDIEFLLVKRYDRAEQISSDGSVAVPHRLHQEDFCQALGIPPEHKYQNEGGPSIKQCAELLRDATSAPVLDLQALLDGVIFNFLIGNNDAHGKNFSLLYEVAGPLTRESRMAPFYDLLSTLYYPDLSKKMAMKIGGEYLESKVLPRHFEHLAEEAGFARTQVKPRVPELVNRILQASPETLRTFPDAESISEFIRQRCERILDRFKA